MSHQPKLVNGDELNIKKIRLTEIPLKLKEFTSHIVQSVVCQHGARRDQTLTDDYSRASLINSSFVNRSTHVLSLILSCHIDDLQGFLYLGVQEVTGGIYGAERKLVGHQKCT